MNSLWMSLKENGNCRSKIILDVISHPTKCSKDKLKNSSNANETFRYSNSMQNKVVVAGGGGGGGGRRGNSFREVTIRRNHSRKRCNLGWENLDVFLRRQNARTQFFELNKGDPARNVIEMIYRRASTNPTNQFREIQMVFKVKNSVEILEKFENYRESVKISAYEQHKKHPRSIVDGNEVLRFYSTTMSCCRGESKRVSELCRDPSCRVCRIIQSNFDTEYTEGTGIRLSTSGEDFCNNGGGVAFSESSAKRRAVIVCRIIAGMVGNKVDEKYEGQNCNSESLIVWNPCAVLPCFVIVFS